jgi:aromatic ring-opening dioxygenase catalytic subunit (LigB family)
LTGGCVIPLQPGFLLYWLPYDSVPARVDAAVSEPDLDTRLKRLTKIETLAPNCRRAHPRSEHLLPLLVVAGAAITPGGDISIGRKIHDAWVRGSFSQASYRFD